MLLKGSCVMTYFSVFLTDKESLVCLRFCSSGLLLYFRPFLACSISASLGYMNTITDHYSVKLLYMLCPKNEVKAKLSP